MSQHNQRKEPTFGQPTNNPVQPNNAAPQPPKMLFSLSSKHAPSYTFTPVMKRPVESADEFSTLEEQTQLQQNQLQQTQLQPENTTMLNNHSTNNPTPNSTPNSSSNAPANAPAEAQNATPKGFAFAPIADEPKAPQAPAAEKTVESPVEKVPAAPVAAAVERVIPAAHAPQKANNDKAPSKYRRLLVVALLAIALLLAFFLLKPNTPEAVESLQEQGTSLPIEFRPVDEEEAKRAEAEAKAAQQAQAQAQTQPQISEQEQAQANTANFINNDQLTPTVEPAQPVVESQPAVQPVVEPKPVVIQPVKKPETQTSVIYQPESKAEKAESVKKAPVQAVQKVEKVAEKAPAKAVKVEAKTEPKAEAKAEKAAKVVEAKPAAVKTAAVSSKTLTVPKGVSLMQVFRDHNLNISDVNAMSKVNNIVSHLKVGEKVTVRLDENNRVSEMHIGSGGKFIRQANGSYIYK